MDLITQFVKCSEDNTGSSKDNTGASKDDTGHDGQWRHLV